MKPVSDEIKRLRKVLEENPRSIQFARLAEYLLRSHQLEEAISICQRGLEHHPTYANGHYILGLCYYEMGDAEEAEAEFNRALLYDPEHLNARHYQARLMKDKEWYNAYILRLKQLLAIDPFDREAREQLEAYEKETVAEPIASESGIFVPEDEEAEVEREEFEKVERAFSEAETAVSEQQEERDETITIDEEEYTEEPKAAEAETVAEPEMTPQEEPERKDYEYILDDIFRDEIGESNVDLIEEEAPASSEGDQPMTERIREAAETLEEEELGLEKEPEMPETEGASAEEAAHAVFEPPSAEPEEEQEAVEEKEPVPPVEESAETEAEEVGMEPPAAGVEEPERSEEKAAAEAPTVSAGTPSEEDTPKKEPIVTSTLGEIYAAQGHYAKAINVYEILLKKDPNNEMYRRKIEELRKKLEEQEDQD